MFRVTVAALAALALAGCVTAGINSKTPREITISYKSANDAQKAAQQAEAHCQQYGRHAARVDTWEQHGMDYATWNCVE